MFRGNAHSRVAPMVAGLTCLILCSCSGINPAIQGRGGYRDLQVPTRWGEYPLAGALARLDDSPGLDWVDHLTNCGLSDAWIEEMQAAWWSERRYSVQTLLRADLEAPIGSVSGTTHQVESVRIRYGQIGGETTAENGLLREARANRELLLESCPLILADDVYWIDEAIYADEVTITLETAAGDTLSGEIVQGLLQSGGHWSVAEDGVMHSTERVYVAFRNATPARSLIESEAERTGDGLAPVRGGLTLLPLDSPISALGTAFYWDAAGLDVLAAALEAYDSRPNDAARGHRAALADDVDCAESPVWCDGFAPDVRIPHRE